MPCHSGDHTSSSLLDCVPLQPAGPPAHHYQASQVACLGNWHAMLMHPGLKPAFCFCGQSLSLLVERYGNPVILSAIALDAALA